jgi:hypothetical protein
MNACKDRYDNYVTHYGTQDFDIDSFLGLDKITYKDKIWVCRRLMNKNQLMLFAILCAESVLHIFEEKYPNDLRPRQCLEYLKTIEDFENLTELQRQDIIVNKNAADAATYAAADAAAAAAAAAAYPYSYAYADAARTEQANLNLEYLKQAMSI